MSNPRVAILMGSDSDWAVVQKAADVLTEFAVPFEKRVLSAHRTPEEAVCYLRGLADRGLQVVICAAGMAAHLAGTAAANTPLPVIGIPLEGGLLHGLDALLSTVQMPGGVPVATMAVGGHGAKNAGLFAVQILALSDKGLQKQWHRYRDEMRKSVLGKDAALNLA